MKKNKDIYPLNISKDFWCYPLKDTVEFVVRDLDGTKVHVVSRKKLKYILGPR